MTAIVHNEETFYISMTDNPLFMINNTRGKVMPYKDLQKFTMKN